MLLRHDVFGGQRKALSVLHRHSRVGHQDRVHDANTVGEFELLAHRFEVSTHPFDAPHVLREKVVALTPELP